MSDRREFIKTAGVLGLTSIAKPLYAVESKTGERSTSPHKPEIGEIVLENADFRLAIRADGVAQSLLHKPTRRECLYRVDVPMFGIIQDRPYDNELQLSLPAERTLFPPIHVEKVGNELHVEFDRVGYLAVISVSVTDSYIAFRLDRLTYHGFNSLRAKRQTPVDHALLVQLPIAERKNFGEWLNVAWDDELAVNLLAANPQTRICADRREGHLLFQAIAEDEVGLEGVEAALIVTRTSDLLDRIEQLEEKYDLPKGAKSRRREEDSYSYYEVSSITPQNAERHIRYAQQCGFRAMDIYYTAFAESAGHFPWRAEYPKGMQDLRKVVGQVREAGLLPGVHIHYNKAHKVDSYVSPTPDHRLNLVESFTLAKAIDTSETVVYVEENPRRCTLDKERRILRIHDEVLSYETYSKQRPFRFEGCVRGLLGSKPASHTKSSRVGLLDVDTWPVFVRFSQNTDIQEEVAKRLGQLYEDAGFQFVYYDGAEDVPPPYWYNVSKAQWEVCRQLQPQPIFAEGACKSHFSWHMLTRGNAFDVFKPEVIKEATREYPAAEVERAANDFTRINFGWIGYWAPAKDTMGTQPDMLEYVTSRAAAWDCPISLIGDLEALDRHARTPDNLETLRRWEEVRRKRWLSPHQKLELRNLQIEHTLLVDESGRFVLRPWKPVQSLAGGDRGARAFIFTYRGDVWASYWHTSGEAVWQLPLSGASMTLMKEIGKPQPLISLGDRSKIPLGDKRYLRFRGLTQAAVERALQQAQIVAI